MLPCPWNFPGKNTTMACHFLLQGISPNQGWNSRLLCVLYGKWILCHWAIREALLHCIYFFIWQILYKIPVLFLQILLTLSNCSPVTNIGKLFEYIHVHILVFICRFVCGVIFPIVFIKSVSIINIFSVWRIANNQILKICSIA